MIRFHRCENCPAIFVCQKCSDTATASYKSATTSPDGDSNMLLYHVDHAKEKRWREQRDKSRRWLCPSCLAKV